MAAPFTTQASSQHNSVNRRSGRLTFSRRYRRLIFLCGACFLLLTLLLISGVEYRSSAQAHLESLLSGSSGKSAWRFGEWGGWQSSGHAAKEGLPYERLSTSTSDVEEKACVDWDPTRDEGDDPVDCLKARQYRQTSRVLAREDKLEQ